MEGLNVCLAEPQEELFGLWLQGLPLEHAVKRRLALMQESVRRFHQHQLHQQQGQPQQPQQVEEGASVSINRSSSSSSSLLMHGPGGGGGSGGSSAMVAALVAEDLVDEFRSFDGMEPYLYQVCE